MGIFAGLAVSGGADSMALAFLCKKLERSLLLRGVTVTAFVVDHKAREESSREARTVAGWLEDVGLFSPLGIYYYHHHHHHNSIHSILI